MMSDPEYWVEARTSIKAGYVMAYQVWHINGAGARERIASFSTYRKGGWPVALHLANQYRDDANAKSGMNVAAWAG